VLCVSRHLGDRRRRVFPFPFVFGFALRGRGTVLACVVRSCYPSTTPRLRRLLSQSRSAAQRVPLNRPSRCTRHSRSARRPARPHRERRTRMSGNVVTRPSPRAAPNPRAAWSAMAVPAPSARRSPLRTHCIFKRAMGWAGSERDAPGLACGVLRNDVLAITIVCPPAPFAALHARLRPLRRCSTAHARDRTIEAAAGWSVHVLHGTTGCRRTRRRLVSLNPGSVAEVCDGAARAVRALEAAI
jgi:hypothetical protein